MNQSYYSGLRPEAAVPAPNPYSVPQKPSVSLTEYARKTYARMFGGLLLTFAVSLLFLLNSSAAASFASAHTPLFHIIMVVEIAAVFVTGVFVTAIPPAVCRVLFWVYAILNGCIFAPILLIYGVGNAVFAFAAAAGVYGMMTVYGMVTKRDLTNWKNALLIGLFGLLLYTAAAMLFRLPVNDLLISLAGVALFIGYTAVDTQKIRHYYRILEGNEALLKKFSSVAAFDLYLDYINLFLYLLRLFTKES